MPGGKRTNRISGRDLRVLEWVARFGVASQSALARRWAMGRTVSYEREKRLRDRGLVELHPSYHDGALLVCTRAGLAAAGRDELRVARPSPWRDHHSALVAYVAASLELSGERLLCERELGARERAEGEQLLSAQVSEYRFHRADLIRLAEGFEAIEVELTPKAPRRLELLLRAWRRAVDRGKLARVIYLCAPEAEPYLRRAVKSTRTDRQVLVLSLALPTVQLPRPASRESGGQGAAPVRPLPTRALNGFATPPRSAPVRRRR
jgi:hypothetical protein